MFLPRVQEHITPHSGQDREEGIPKDQSMLRARLISRLLLGLTKGNIQNHWNWKRASRLLWSKTLKHGAKMSWAAARQTRRVEDEAYSLLGIFGVFIPLVYGRGAMPFGGSRRSSSEPRTTTVLVWSDDGPSSYCSMLAASARAFKSCDSVVSYCWFITGQARK